MSQQPEDERACASDSNAQGVMTEIMIEQLQRTLLRYLAVTLIARQPSAPPERAQHGQPTSPSS
jgi:hypothetical protein